MKALQFLEIPKERVLMIGDNVFNDVKTPISLGLNAIHLSRNYINYSKNNLSYKTINSLFELI
jgi:FMN phosphatase YigB (HAD superfamily)